MTPENFVYWLQGFFEILSAGPKTPEKLTLTADQVTMIETHLGYVFKHQEEMKTPNIVFNPPYQQHQIIQPILQPSNPQQLPGTQQPWPGYPQPYVTCQTGQGAQGGGQGGVQTPNMGAILAELSKTGPLTVTC